MNLRYSTYRLFALLVALNYFAFRTELLKDEYNDNHPAYSDVQSFTCTSLTWETFDKDNAPQACSVNAEIRIEFISDFRVPIFLPHQFYLPFQPIRDKSPPSASLCNA